MITVSDFYKSLFGEKVYKISLDAGCTCPNRDGTLDTRGCIFCNSKGSGDFTANPKFSIEEQVEEAKEKVISKIKSENPKFIAYFQNFTNTYGNIKNLEQKWKTALAQKNVIGLAIGTRPDCITEEVLAVLKEISEKSFVQLELGFQTSNEKTAEFIRRCYKNEVYFDAVKKIKAASPEIHIVTHVIFGLFYKNEENKIQMENEQDMLKTVEEVLKSGSDGIKISCLYILKGTDLEKLYEEGKIHSLSQGEYFYLLEKAIQIIENKLVIHRFTGDPPKNLVIDPLWTANKKKVLTVINQLKQKY